MPNEEIKVPNTDAAVEGDSEYTEKIRVQDPQTGEMLTFDSTGDLMKWREEHQENKHNA